MTRPALALWLLSVASVSAYALVRRAPRAVPRPPALPSVVVLRPCAGVEPELRLCLSSWPSRGAASARVIFAVAEAGDAALPEVLAAARVLGDRGVDARVILIGARAPNRKAAQLAAAAEEAREAEVLVVADSDVDLTGLDLAALVGPITADASVAACWAPPVEHGEVRTLGDRASQALLGASLHAFPLLARLDRRTVVGKLLAVRRSSLDAVGGFASLAHVLGEDFELARRLHRRGERVVVAGVTARSLASGRAFPAVVARYARWLAVVRGQRPILLASYPLLFASAPLVAAAALAAGAPGLAGAALALRVLVARAAQAACGRRGSLPDALVEAALADALLLAALARVLASREVLWRGERLRVLPGGRLTVSG